MASPLFRGPESLRVRSERRRLVWTLLALPLTLALVGFVLQNSFTVRNLMLLLVGTMLYVALARGRGRFLGGGVRVGETQFPQLQAIVDECARKVGIAAPHVFLRDDPFTPVVALGTGEPYALVVSSEYLEHFGDDELRFLIGRELGHIAAGHTKLTSLLSANGRENAAVAIAFGAWLRTIEYTADRVGLLCCNSLHNASAAIAVSTFKRLGRKVDLHAFAEQRRELDAEPSLRMGEWLAASPFATNRIARLAHFAHDPLYVSWSRRFAAAERAAPEPRETTYAGPLRRALALVIDYIVVSALLPPGANAPVKVGITPHETAVLADGLPPAVVHAVSILMGPGVSLGTALAPFVLTVYVVLLVAFAGQTLGMMILDLRVVGDRRERIGIRRAIARYVLFALSLPAVVGIIGLFRTIQPFERWSRTRLVAGGATTR